VISTAAAGSRSPVRGTRLLRWRWLLLLAWAAYLFPRGWSPLSGDWHYFVSGADLLTGADGLHVFARHPELHMGPLSLVATWALRLPGGSGLGPAIVLMWALGLGSLLLLERAAVALRGDDPLVRLTTLLGGLLFLKAWLLAGGAIGHIDDVLAMAGTALAVWAVATRRPWLAGAAVGLAVAAKPWGIIVLPLCLAFPWPGRLRAVATAVGVGLAAWLPFVVADRGTTGAGSYAQLNDPASALHALGVHAAGTPGWVRPAQVLLALALGVLAVRLGRWPAAVSVALAARIALDPAVFTYYAPTLVLGGLVCDLLVLRRPLPLWTAVTYAAVVAAPVSIAAGTLGAIRLAACVALVVASLVPLASLTLNLPHRAADT
jgi:hypothetical protein